MIKTGGGSFDPTEKQIYFIAVNCTDFAIVAQYSRYCLVAVNELESPSSEETLKKEINNGMTLFLDSGVFSLASEHARKHGMSHDEALTTPLDEIDGFQVLYDRYIRLVKEYESKLWGYVEIDLGGTEQKRRTRAKLESLGLRPIPVYHPLSDGWDYFDELASKYDRICVGNIVQASRYVRLRIMATISERKKKYPNLWIHLLGMTPNEWANAYPMNSMDSSTWVNVVRWPDAWKERTCLKATSAFSRGYYYTLGNTEQWYQAKMVAVIQAMMNQRNWRNLQEEVNK